MATAEIRMRASELAQRLARRPLSGLPAPLALLEAERSEEIFPILLEQIVALGFPRALVATVDFESGQVRPTAALNAARAFLDRFTLSLYAGENPIIRAVQTGGPVVVRKSESQSRALYCHPMLFRSRSPCWEAEHERRGDCLAVENFERRRKLRLEQVCAACDMRAYNAIVGVELPRKFTHKQLTEAGELVTLANRYLSRLFKVEHYYNRMRDMDVTISQMGTVMQSMPDPVILTDTQHRVIMQNKAAERFFMLPEEVSEGRVRAVELNNLLFSALLSSIAISGGEASRDITLVDAIEGEEMLFEAVTAPTFGREGLAVGMVTVMRDVTDLRRADQELRANYEKLRSVEEVVRLDRDRLNLIIENVGDPIVVCDNAARIALLDPLAQQLFGSGAEGDRHAAQRVKNRATLDAYITAFTFSFADKQTAPLRLFNTDTRSETEYDARSGKIYDERGTVVFTVTVLRDLTAVRRVEQLKLERRLLEIEKFAATGRLAATIAHEVNNPMEAIKNAIYLLSGALKPEGQPVYQILKGETDRVARIVRQMLGLYRAKEQLRAINLNNIVEDTLLLLRRQLERANVSLASELGELPETLTSPDQIRQVLSNLLINARDSMPKGGRLMVRTRHLPAPDQIHGHIQITIADTGVGIPPEIIKSIFEPFVTTKGEKGTGLGLWIVQGIVQNHGGKLRVRSKVGQGTVFRIDLPVVR